MKVLLSHGGSSRGISCLLFTRIVLVPNYRICELVYFHTEHRGRSRGFVTNYRIVEFLFTRRVTGFCHELSNYRISFHTESHGESRDLCHELSNYRISFHTEDHGGFLCHETCSWSRICELVFFTRNVTDSRGGYEGGTIEA